MIAAVTAAALLGRWLCLDGYHEKYWFIFHRDHSGYQIYADGKFSGRGSWFSWQLDGPLLIMSIPGPAGASKGRNAIDLERGILTMEQMDSWHDGAWTPTPSRDSFTCHRARVSDAFPTRDFQNRGAASPERPRS